MSADIPLTDAEMWQAVTSNDAAYDGAFVYAVTTTGVFCRPSCKSRDPKPENVAYYPTPAAAQQAGFRPCKRCTPDTSQPDDVVIRVREMCAYIAAHLDDGDLSLDHLATVFHLSPYHLQRTFRAVMGVSPKAYADSLRADRFRDHLRNGANVTDAIYAAGYGSSSRAYERDTLGMTPSSYQSGGSDQTITYTVVPCRLGTLLVAGPERGLCAVRLGDDVAALLDELRAEFPAAALVADDGSLATATAAILDYLAGELPHLDLPLDVQATAFQRRVWDELRRIPPGETRTYGQVAAAIGEPTAARAVGNAVGQNPVALVIPCHRVIRADGKPGGYRWGVARKQSLLATETRP